MTLSSERKPSERHEDVNPEEREIMQRLRKAGGTDKDLFFSLCMAQCVVGQIDRGEVKLTRGNRNRYKRLRKLLKEKGVYPLAK